MASRTDSPSKGLHPYPIIPPLISGTENASGTGPSVPRGLPTLSDIHSNILVLQQAQVKIQMNAQTDRTTLNSLATSLARLLDAEELPRGHSISRDYAPGSVRSQSEYHNTAPNSPVPPVEQVHPAREVPEYSKFRSVKVPDPSKLSNGKSPTYNYWQVQIISKFKVNTDYYINEDARIYYIFNCIEGDTQYYLYTRYKPDATDPFETAIEIINYLGKHFINPYCIYKARRKYKKL
jgi:hypothetical protein